jgi:hypothetical protein
MKALRATNESAFSRLPGGRRRLVIQRTLDGPGAALKNISVDHGGLDILVTEQFPWLARQDRLDGADIVAILEKLGGKGMPESMRRNGFVQPDGQGSLADSLLHHGDIQVVAVRTLRNRIHRSVEGGENVLPGEFLGGIGIFLGQGIGERNFTKALLQVLSMDQAADLDLFPQALYQRIGQDGRPVVLAPFDNTACRRQAQGKLCHRGQCAGGW